MAFKVRPDWIPSLPEAYRSVKVGQKGWLRKTLAFSGPAYLVSVGYMDPGNWATDLEGGSRFGYALLWVILMSNLMAMVLQTLCARLGVVTGRDLAQSCRDYYKRPAAIALWVLCELAIIACDIAEVIGSAVALNLLFGLNLVAGVLLTGLDVLVLLGLLKFGFRKIEAIVITLVGTIGLCFVYEMLMAKPDMNGVVHGLFVPQFPHPDAVFIAVAIIGATVMPHNLYLHSSLVQTRDFANTPEGKREAVRKSTLDTLVALGCAFFVNAAILILAAAVFYKAGVVVTEFRQAPELLKPALGGAAATIFSVALLASGQSSTITATLAGQIVMEGFLHIRMAPWKRRMITRALAIIPAVILILANSGRDTVQMIAFTQVVLALQLPFALVPLITFTSDRKRMGEFASPIWLTVLAWTMALLIIGLNVAYLANTLGPIWVVASLGAVALFAAWVSFFYKPKATEMEALEPQSVAS